MTARQPHTQREHPDAGKEALVRAHTPLVWQPDGATGPSLAKHVTDLISVDGLKASLGIAELAIQLPAFPEKLQPVKVIESPDWAALVDLTAAVRPIVAPAWAAPQRLPVAGRIERQSWGRDVHLPVVKRIALTPEGADATEFAVPLSRAWQRIGATDAQDAAPQWGDWQQPKYVSDTSIWRPAKMAGRPEPHPIAEGEEAEPTKSRFQAHSDAKAAAKARQSDQPQQQPQQQRPPKAKKVVLVEPKPAPAEPEATLSELAVAGSKEPTTHTDSESNKVAIETPFGLWNVLGKSIGTVLLAVVALMGTFVALEVTKEASHGLAEQALERGVQPPEAGLHPLAQLGNAEAPLQLVLACAPATVECIDVTKNLVTLQKAQPETIRLVWLPLVQSDKERPLVDALMAARRQVKLWPVLENLSSADVWTAPIVQEAVLAGGGEADRFAKDLVDPEVHMQTRSYQTMAVGLLIGQGGVLVAGKVVSLQEAVQVAQSALVDTHNRLQEGQQIIDLQQRVDLPDPNAAERYQHWILHGARMPAVAPSDQPMVPAGMEIELDL